jgi:hypothetical protein
MMDCCKPKETMPGLKEEPKENGSKVLIAAFLILVLIGGLLLVFL